MTTATPPKYQAQYVTVYATAWEGEPMLPTIRTLMRQLLTLARNTGGRIDRTTRPVWQVHIKGSTPEPFNRDYWSQEVPEPRSTALYVEVTTYMTWSPR